MAQTIVDVLRDYTGSELTSGLADQLADSEFEQFPALLERLAPFYYDWLENEEIRRASDARDIFHTVEPFTAQESVDERLDKYKALLLYFPSLAVPDPLANLLWPPIIAATLFGEFALNDHTESLFRTGLRDALELIAQLAPLVDRGDVTLIPSPFGLDYTKIQEAARADVARYANVALPFEDPQYRFVGATCAWGHVCAACDYTPVAAEPAVAELIRLEARELGRLPARNIEFNVAELLSTVRLHKVARIPLRDVIALRKNDAAFAAWRRSFGTLLDRVHAQDITNEALFEREFSEAAKDLLTPEIERLDKQFALSPFTDFALPGAAGLAGSAITMVATHGAFGPGGLAAAPITFVGKLLWNRFNKAGTKAHIVRQFFTYLTAEAT